jgi:hypothetical protein
MTIWTQRIVAAAGLIVAVALFIWSTPDGRQGYEFPRLVALVMVILSVALAALAFKPGRMVIPLDVESIPWRIIWPMLVILAAMAFLAPRLGFIATSFLVFVATGLIYSPERFSLRRLAFVVFIALCFSVSLYLLFVLLLNVHFPRALLL